MTDAPISAARKGARLLDKRRPAEAIPLLHQAVEDDPQDWASRLRLGKAYIQNADPFRAVTILEALLKASPDYPEAMETLGAAYRRDARYQDVLRLSQDVKNPNSQILYERGMAYCGLGHSHEALDAFDRCLEQKPDLAAGWYASHGPALDLNGWQDSRRRLEQALSIRGANGKYKAMLACYEILRGDGTTEIQAVPPQHAYVYQGAQALRSRLHPNVRLFGVSAALLRWSLSQATLDGLIVEYGVRRGASLTVLAECAGQDVHGFDSFEGLPEDWSGTRSGVLTTGLSLPQVPSNAHLYPGWFEDSLPPFFAQTPGPIRFANIDSDIYSSACTALAAMADRLRPGSVLVFDEFIGNRSWADDEYKAFHEFAAAEGWSWELLAVGPATKQVALRLTGRSL